MLTRYFLETLSGGRLATL